jgi:leucyl aminopeptidase (aminopeptidase T)
LAGRPSVIEDGLATLEKAARGTVTFLPSGSVEVSANEDSAKGTVVYDRPIRRSGAVVRYLRLRFEDGRVISSHAKEHGSAFTEYLRHGGDAGKFAFFGFGLNPALLSGYTQDDKVLGAVTIGIGDNEGKAGRNRAKGAEWWGCLSGATVTIGRRTVMRGGTLRPVSR